jgi:SAM-dependent methyltransferase
MRMTNARWQRIHDAQREEIRGLVEDTAFARRAASLPHFSRIGEWLETERGGRVLELGCGPGRYVAMLAALGFDVTGVDPVRYPTWSLLARPNINLRSETSAEALPFANRSFDAIACMGALLYFHDLDRAFSEMRRVLRPGGRLVVRTANRGNLYSRFSGQPMDPAGTNVYTLAGLEEELRARGFEVHDSFTYGFYPPIGVAAWWYLSNCTLPYAVQQWLSRLTPGPARANLVVFASAPDAGGAG